MKFITLHFSSNNLPFQMNATLVSLAYTSSSAQTIVGINGATYNVKESPEEILALINSPEIPPAPEPEVVPFTIEAGKRYVKRNREVSGIIITDGPSRTNNYPFQDPNSGYTYTPQGKRYSTLKHGTDLVSEYVEPIPEPVTLKLEAGKQYVKRNGEVSGPLNTSGGLTFGEGRARHTYYPDGRTSSSKEYPDDLVSEYVEPPLILEAGKRYVRRDGLLTPPLQYRDGRFTTGSVYYNSDGRTDKRENGRDLISLAPRIYAVDTSTDTLTPVTIP